MNRYAMVLLNRVIDVVMSDNEVEWPPDMNGNPVFAIPCDDDVTIGMFYENGKFVTELSPEPDPPISDMEQAIIDTALNIEYLLCMADSAE